MDFGFPRPTLPGVERLEPVDDETCKPHGQGARALDHRHLRGRRSRSSTRSRSSSYQLRGRCQGPARLGARRRRLRPRRRPTGARRSRRRWTSRRAASSAASGNGSCRGSPRACSATSSMRSAASWPPMGQTTNRYGARAAADHRCAHALPGLAARGSRGRGSPRPRRARRLRRARPVYINQYVVDDARADVERRVAGRLRRVLAHLSRRRSRRPRHRGRYAGPLVDALPEQLGEHEQIRGRPGSPGRLGPDDARARRWTRSSRRRSPTTCRSSGRRHESRSALRPTHTVSSGISPEWRASSSSGRYPFVGDFAETFEATSVEFLDPAHPVHAAEAPGPLYDDVRLLRALDLVLLSRRRGPARDRIERRCREWLSRRRRRSAS